MSLADYLETAPDYERPISEALVAHLATMEDAVVEPVSIGLLAKRRSTFAELRTKTRWVALRIKLPRVVEDPAPDLKVQPWSGSHHHTWNLRTVDDLTPLLGLLDEAYEADV